MTHLLLLWCGLSVLGAALWKVSLSVLARRSARRWSDLAPGYKPTLTLHRNANTGFRSRSGAGGSDAA